MPSVDIAREMNTIAEQRRANVARHIMMTADDTPEILLRSFQEQADRFIRKPFPPRRIVEIANDVLSASPISTYLPRMYGTASM